MSGDFQRGDLAECIDASFDPERSLPWEDGAEPIEGAVYTVDALGYSHGAVKLYFKDLHRGPAAIAAFGFDPGYAAQRFRRVYRPKAELLTNLMKAPADAPNKEPVAA